MFNVNEIPTLTPTFAKQFLSDRSERKLASNTTLRIWQDDEGETWFVVRLHRTDIAKVSADGTRMILNSGGWQTVTTKQRLNQLLPKARTHGFERYGTDVGISQRAGEWFISGSHDQGTEWKVPFTDGVELRVRERELNPTVPVDLLHLQNYEVNA